MGGHGQQHAQPQQQQRPNRPTRREEDPGPEHRHEQIPVPGPGDDPWDLGPILDAAALDTKDADALAERVTESLGPDRRLAEDFKTRFWLQKQDPDAITEALGRDGDIAARAKELLDPNTFILDAAPRLDRVPLEVRLFMASEPKDRAARDFRFDVMQDNLLRIAVREIVDDLEKQLPLDPEGVDDLRTSLPIPYILQDDPRLIEELDERIMVRLCHYRFSVALRVGRNPPPNPFRPESGFATQGSWQMFYDHVVESGTLGGNDLAGVLARNIAPDVLDDVEHLFGFMLRDWGMSGDATRRSRQMTPAPGRISVVDAVPGQDVMYEQMARWCYGAQAGDEATLLQSWGYERRSTVLDGEWGMQLATFVPGGEAVARQLDNAGRELRPVLAFAGTNAAEMADIADDLTPEGVGLNQFSANEARIVDELDALSRYGKVDVIGHSLGGALAQITSVLHRAGIGRVVTFQAPGVGKGIKLLEGKQAADDNRAGRQRVEATHYQLVGDEVGRAGHARTSGVDRVVNPSQALDAGPAHVAHLLPSIAGGASLGISNPGVGRATVTERSPAAGPLPLEASRAQTGGAAGVESPPGLVDSWLVERGKQLVSQATAVDRPRLQVVYSELHRFEVAVTGGTPAQKAVDEALPAGGIGRLAQERWQRYSDLLHRTLGQPQVALDFTPKPAAPRRSPATPRRGGGGGGDARYTMGLGDD